VAHSRRRFPLSAIIWDPEGKKPAEAAELEEEIRAAAPDAEVKLTLRGKVWVARALRPAALCGRGHGALERDVSAAVAAVLLEAGLRARA
jgi:hypothetical protein